MKKICAMILCLAVLLCAPAPCLAQEGGVLEAAAADTAMYLLKTVSQPAFGSVGGEWEVIGLARGGMEVLSTVL